MSPIASDKAILALSPKGEEVSIKSLKKKEIDKIMKAVTAGKDVADSYYKDTIEPKILYREEVYDATVEHYERKFPRLSETSHWVSRDIKTAIDQIIPSLMEVFTGPDDPVDVVARNVEGVEKARKIQQLLKYQLETKNDYTTFCYDTLVDHLKLNHAVARVWWKHEEERTPMQIMLSPEDYAQMAYFSEMSAAGLIEITKVKEVEGGYYNIEYDEVKVTANYPVVERLPPSELRYSPEACNIQDCKFVAHRKIVKGDYLKRREQEGFYENVDKALKACGDINYTTYDKEHNKALNDKTQQLSDGDDASKDVELYECYVNVDYNNDGIYEKLIVHTVGDSGIPIKIQTNEFDEIPFFVMPSERDPAAIFNEHSGFTDVIEQQQDLKTAVIRQLIVNIAKSNHPQMAVDQANVDIDALLGNEEIIATRGMPQNLLMPISVSPLNQATMSIVEYAQNEIEAQTGSTRYNQGLDSSSLNKTATGITAILGQADKRLKNLARIDAELFFKPIFRLLIRLNQKFAEEEQIIRIGDRNISVSADDLDVDYDLILNVGQGAGTKEARINYLMLLLQQLIPMLTNFGVANEATIYTAAKSLTQEMGLPGLEKTLIDPNSDAFKAMQQQKQQAAMQQAQAAAQAEIVTKKAVIDAKADAEIRKRRVPEPHVDYPDLPVDAQAGIIQNMGLSTSPLAMFQREASHVQQNSPYPRTYREDQDRAEGRGPAGDRGFVPDVGTPEGGGRPA